MPTLVYTLSNIQRTNLDYKKDQTFTATATGSPVANATLNSGSLYFSAVKTWRASMYLTLSLNGATATTGTFTANTTSHAETVSLTAFSQSLLTAGTGTVTFTCKEPGTWTSALFNLRDTCTGTLTLNYTLNYSQCGAPTSVTVNANNVYPGRVVTLSWSGAKAGQGMSISIYQVYRATAPGGPYTLLHSVGSSATSGSLAVTAPTANGSSYYYKVMTVGTVAGYSSPQSTAYATLTCSFTAPTAPTKVTVNGASEVYVLPNTNVTMAWSGAAAGTNNPITGYDIYSGSNLKKSVDTTAASGSATVPSIEAGKWISYKVLTKGTYSNAGFSVEVRVHAYTDPTAPTSLLASNTAPDAGTDVTLTWAGGARGSYNDISGYEVYRATAAAGPYTLLKSVSSAAASASTTVKSHATMGAAYYFKIVTVGVRSKSAQSTVYATVTSATYTACIAPTSVTLSAALVNPGGTATLGWSGAAGGTGNPIVSYIVYRAAEAGGVYSQIGASSTNSLQVAAHETQGSSYFFKVVAVGSKSGFDSSMSAYAALKTNTAPSAVTIQSPASGRVTHNPRPRILVTVGADVDEHTQTVIAAGYVASSGGQLAPGRKVVLRRGSELERETALSESISSTDALGLASAITRSFSYVPAAFADDTLIPGNTAIKALHINDLREAVGKAREYYGMTPTAWGESVAAGITSLAGWKAHVLEIRASMEEIAAFVNGWDTASSTNNIVLPAWIEITVNKPTAAAMHQLRAAVTLL